MPEQRQLRFNINGCPGPILSSFLVPYRLINWNASERFASKSSLLRLLRMNKCYDRMMTMDFRSFNTENRSKYGPAGSVRRSNVRTAWPL